MRTFLAALLVLTAGAGGARAQTLANGHFASPYIVYDSNTSVANGWSHYRVSQSPQFKQSDFEQMPGGPGGQVSCQQIWADWSAFDAGVYQRVTGAAVGQTYRATGWFLSIYRHGDVSPPYQDGSIYQKIGIDPTGGTDPNSPAIVWSWDDPLDRRWREITVDATAQAAAITVFARTRNLYAQTNCLSFYDAFALRASNPVRVSGIKIRPQSTQATVTWTTDVPAASRVDYLVYRGPDKDYTTAADSELRTQHSVIITGLTENTEYYCRIISSAPGMDDAVSGGHTFKTLSGQVFSSLREARANPDGTRVLVRDLVVTSGSNQSSSYIFVQQADRTCGIRVDKPLLVTIDIGEVIDVSGTLATVGGERKLSSITFNRVSSGPGPAPLAMGNACVGGSALDSHNPGVTDGVGGFNLGLLARVWGRITHVDAANKFFYIDDGSGLEDGTAVGRKGVRVMWSQMTGVPASPTAGMYAVLVGMASCFQSGGRTVPQILLRRASDMRKF